MRSDVQIGKSVDPSRLNYTVLVMLALTLRQKKHSMPFLHYDISSNIYSNATFSVTLTDRLPVIVASLKRIQREGNPSENFVIFIADNEKNYFIQVAPESDASPYSPNIDEYSLYAEAVGNTVLASHSRLRPTQIAELSGLGWNVSFHSPNYYQTWRTQSDEERSLIAQIIVSTFIKVYEALPRQKIDGQVVIPSI